MKVTAVFDIGKTNKKFFLFDKNYQKVFNEYSRFDETKDEDGEAYDDLPAIQGWVKSTFQKISTSATYTIQAINFSCYGASLVHLDKGGKPLTPLYNYLKPYPKDLLNKFYGTYGDKMIIARETASPPLQMLNSGLQLYYLKYKRPELFKKVRWSLHFPQYLSFLFTGVPLSEYTSIGCHTMLWDYAKKDYHQWVYTEGFDRILPPIAQTNTSINKTIKGVKIHIGVGIHDSSAALLPYLKSDNSPFLLLSTGTWSISLNPFTKEALTSEDLNHDCLNFLRIDGRPVKAARMFLGNEYKQQVKKLHAFYQKDQDHHQKVKYNETLFLKLKKSDQHCFNFASLRPKQKNKVDSDWKLFPNFATACHQLILELTELQVECIKRATGNSNIAKIYIDGGFSANEVFVKLLSARLKEVKLEKATTPLGSALGAALAFSEKKVGKDVLENLIG